MKVLYLIPGLGSGGGSEKSLLAVTPHLAAAGIELTIAYFVVRPTDNAAAYEEAGATVVRLPATSSVARTLAVRKLLKHLQPDVLHTTLYEADQAGRFAAAGLPVRVITSFTSSNYDVARRQDPTYRWWRVELVRGFASFTARRLSVGAHAVSEAARQAAARAFGMRIDEIAVVHRGRELEAFRGIDPAVVAALRDELGLAPTGRLILSIGRHEFQKDQVTLVAALAEVRRSHPDAVLAIAGREGAMTPALRRAMAEHGVEDAVLLLGNRTDVAALLAAADVVAFSSILEGFSGVMLEVIAAGRPLVASAIPPNREVLRGSPVRMVTPGDASGFAAGIVDALDDPEASAARTDAALERVRSWISVEHASQGMEALYRSLAQPGSRVVATPPADRRPRRLLVVDDLGGSGPAATAAPERVAARIAAGEEVAVATFAVGDRQRMVEIEDLGAVVHHLAGTSRLGRAISLRRLERALDPVTVERPTRSAGAGRGAP